MDSHRDIVIFLDTTFVPAYVQPVQKLRVLIQMTCKKNGNRRPIQIETMAYYYPDQQMHNICIYKQCIMYLK